LTAVLCDDVIKTTVVVFCTETSLNNRHQCRGWARENSSTYCSGEIKCRDYKFVVRETFGGQLQDEFSSVYSPSHSLSATYTPQGGSWVVQSNYTL